MDPKKTAVAIMIGTGSHAGKAFSQKNIEKTLEDLGLPAYDVWTTNTFNVLQAIWASQGLSWVGLFWILRYLTLGAQIEFVVAELTNGGRVIVGSRHGKGHTVPPSGIDWALNTLVLIHLGATWVWTTSACGIIEGGKAKQGVPALIRQSFDQSGDGTTFFRFGPAAHVSLADPSCSSQDEFLTDIAMEAGIKLGVPVNYVTIPGPHFGNRLTSAIWSKLGIDVVGQSFDRECRVSREARMHYSCFALPTDFDAKPGEEVSQEVVDAALAALVEPVIEILKVALQEIYTTDAYDKWECRCEKSLKGAEITKGPALGNRHKRLLGFLHNWAHLGQ